MKDLQKIYGYAKVIEIVMFIKEKTESSIKRLEAYLLSETKKYVYPVPHKKEYRNLDNKNDIENICQNVANKFSDHVELIM